MGTTTRREEIRSEALDYDRVNLGCGDEYLPGWYNIDIREDVDPDAVWNLNERPWPFPDDCFDRVLFDNVLEHLRDQYSVLSELHRITKVDGQIIVAGPHWNSAGAWIDPTHTRPFDPRTFEHYLVSDWFDIAELTVDKVRWAKWLPDEVALWLADTFGQGVSGFEVTVTPTSKSKSEHR